MIANSIQAQDIEQPIEKSTREKLKENEQTTNKIALFLSSVKPSARAHCGLVSSIPLSLVTTLLCLKPILFSDFSLHDDVLCRTVTL